MTHWSSVLSYNRYDVGIAKEEYFIWLGIGTPVKSYDFCCSPAVIGAIESELEKIKNADLLSLQTVLILLLPSV